MGKGLGIAIASVIAIFLIVVLPIWGSYNGMVTAGNTIDKSWEDVQAAYQRRLDVIPRIAEVAKFSVDAQLTLNTEVAKLREGYDKAGSPSELEAVNTQVSGIYANVRAEAVPTLDTAQLPN